MVCEDTRQAKCNTCGQTVSRGGGTLKTFNTTNLVQHLKAKHPTEYAHFWAKVAADATTMAACKSVRHQLMLDQAEDRVRCWDINDARAQKIHRCIGEMIALHLQPRM